MTDPRPYNIARWIADGIQSTSYVPLRSEIEFALKTHIPAWSEEIIAETAEKYESNIFQELEKITDLTKRDGVEPSFLLDGEPGTAYIKGENLEAISILNIIKKKTPDEFEQFCADLLSLLGGITRKVGRSGDGGVDFIATDLPVSNHKFMALQGGFPIVIGQAKRYKEDNFVSVNDVRDFLGGAMLKQDEIKRENERFGLFSPVIYAFWSTSDFTLPAYEFMREAGIWYLGGLALAQLTLHINKTISP
jgi:restriction endonuclease Mrr